MSIRENIWGTLDGKKVFLYSFVNSSGAGMSVTNYGGTLVSVSVPDKNGKLSDVVLGYESLEGYMAGNSYFGATIGRYANRIEDAGFELNGRYYRLAANDGKNHLHGGLKGFDSVVWEPEIVDRGGVESLKLTYSSPAGEEGYPGNLDATVIYSFTDNNELRMDYSAVSDKATPVNLTNHSYFNLSGHNSKNMLNHRIFIDAGAFLAISSECIPTGEILPVAGTPMDLTRPAVIGDGIASSHEQIIYGEGYDHNWLLNNHGDITRKAAELFDPKSGRVLEVYTTKPGLQFYSGNFINETARTGKNRAKYEKWGGLCLETQYYPNSMKHTHFPSPILQAGQVYRHSTIYKFAVR